MTSSHAPSFDTPRCAAFVLAALLTGTAIAQDARLDADCSPQLTRLQQRLYQKASEGPDALRNFMFIRRGILQLDINETGAWADSLKQARVVCLQRSAKARSIPPASNPVAEPRTVSRLGDAAPRPTRDGTD